MRHDAGRRVHRAGPRVAAGSDNNGRRSSRVRPKRSGSSRGGKKREAVAWGSHNRYPASRSTVHRRRPGPSVCRRHVDRAKDALLPAVCSTCVKICRPPPNKGYVLGQTREQNPSLGTVAPSVRPGAGTPSAQRCVTTGAAKNITRCAAQAVWPMEELRRGGDAALDLLCFRR